MTAALIQNSEGEILIARRRLDAPVEAGKWEFPGGKVEEGEHPEVGLVREIREELGFEIAVEKFFELSSHVYALPGKSLHIVLLAYHCRVVSGEPQAIDVAEYRWIQLPQLANFDFAAADLLFIAKLKREGLKLP